MAKISKLGIGIVAFDGSEHLKNICSEIRNEVDYILVCLQNVSYFGEQIDLYDVTETTKLKDMGLIDEIMWFNPDLSYKNFTDEDIINYKNNLIKSIENDVSLRDNIKEAIIEKEKNLSKIEIINRMPRILETQKRNLMIDRLEEDGIIGPAVGAKPREVLITHIDE